MTIQRPIWIVFLVSALASCRPTPAVDDGTVKSDVTEDVGTDLGSAASVKWLSVSTGYSHACGVTSQGRVACWGRNTAGQLGDGTTASRWQPKLVPKLSDIAAVTADWDSTCAVSHSGQVWCWGQAPAEIISGAALLPIAIAATKPVAQFAMIPEWVCARYTDGTAGCLGLNASSKLAFTAVAGISGARQIGFNGAQLCWLDTEFLIACLPDWPELGQWTSKKTFAAFAKGWTGRWVGLDTQGQLWLRGHHRLSPPPVGCTTQSCPEWTALPGASGIVGMSGDCGRRADGTVLCWNQLPGTAVGNGFPYQAGAVEVSSLAGSVQLTGQGGMQCALAPNGTVRCWGEMCCTGVLNQWTPGVVNGFADAKALYGGNGGYCATDSLGRPWCWGMVLSSVPGMDNFEGAVPTLYNGLPGVTIGDAMVRSICGANGLGVLTCRGESDFLFGTKKVGPVDCLSAPCQLPDAGKDIAAVFAGDEGFHFRWCAIDGQGHLRCWGYNTAHAADLGADLPTFASVWPPQLAEQMPPALSGCTGNDFGCVVVAGGEVWCWGNGSLWLQNSTDPKPIAGLSGVNSVHCRYDAACAVTHDGKVLCWGMLPAPAGYEPSGPVAVQGLPPVTTLATAGNASVQHTCAIDNSGAVWCFGFGDSGELGLGEAVTATAVPLKVAGLGPAVAVAMGWGHTCVALQDGGLRCWGRDVTNELGNDAPPVSELKLMEVPVE